MGDHNLTFLIHAEFLLKGSKQGRRKKTIAGWGWVGNTPGISQVLTCVCVFIWSMWGGGYRTALI